MIVGRRYMHLVAIMALVFAIINLYNVLYLSIPF